MQLTLADLRTGTCAEVVSISAADADYRRMLGAMGVLPGTVVKVLREAPLGDPVQVAVRGFRLVLRRDEAFAIEVKRLQ